MMRRSHQPFFWILVLLMVSGVLAPAAADDRVPEDLDRFRIARLQYAGGGDWYANPSSLPNLLEGLRRRTGLPVAGEEKVLQLDDERLYSYPLLYITGHGTIRLSPEDRLRLRRGGFGFRGVARGAASCWDCPAAICSSSARPSSADARFVRSCGAPPPDTPTSR